jgi:hypothetical protein
MAGRSAFLRAKTVGGDSVAEWLDASIQFPACATKIAHSFGVRDASYSFACY